MGRSTGARAPVRATSARGLPGGPRVLQILERLHTNLWFIPGILTAALCTLAVLLVYIQPSASALAERWPVLFGISAEGARSMLSAIATSMMTVGGVSFSLTVLSLTVASQQYTPRVIRNFMKSRATQACLGMFVGIYAYCLVVLRSVRSGGDDAFVPSLAVMGGVVLAVVGIGWMIFFIHHMASSIQASQIVTSVSRETREVLDRLFPEELGEEAAPDEAAFEAAVSELRWHPVRAPQAGYIQAVSLDGLLAFARERDVILKMERAIGDFILPGGILASVSRPMEEDDAAALNRCYAVGGFRTIEQDAGYGVQQLVDIALKALSPAINDPTTAMGCVHQLGALLAALATRRDVSPYRKDGDTLRVVARGDTFGSVAAQAFTPILRAGRDDPTLFLAVLDTLARVAEVTRHAERRRVLAREVDKLVERAQTQLVMTSDREAVLQRADRLRHALGVETTSDLSSN